MQKRKEYLFLLIGNSTERYVSKEDLYQECLKYKNNDVYKCELKEAVKEALKIKSDKVIMIIRKLLRVWRYSRAFKGELADD